MLVENNAVMYSIFYLPILGRIGSSKMLVLDYEPLFKDYQWLLQRPYRTLHTGLPKYPRKQKLVNHLGRIQANSMKVILKVLQQGKEQRLIKLEVLILVGLAEEKVNKLKADWILDWLSVLGSVIRFRSRDGYYPFKMDSEK